jgi:hypothetical protein
MVELMVEQLVE